MARQGRNDGNASVGKNRSQSERFIRCELCEKAGKEVFKAQALSRKAWKLYKDGSSHFLNHEQSTQNVSSGQLPLPTL